MNFNKILYTAAFIGLILNTNYAQAMLPENEEPGLNRGLPLQFLWEPDNIKEITHITPTSLQQLAPRIAVLENANYKGGECILACPDLLAEEVRKTCMTYFGVASLSKTIHTPLLFSRVLEEEGYLNARKVHGLQPLPAPENWEKLSWKEQLAQQHREIISWSDIDKFKDPAVVYELQNFRGELVLSTIITFPKDLRERFASSSSKSINANRVSIISNGDITVENFNGNSISLVSKKGSVTAKNISCGDSQ